jgi:Flp pilus assembly protein TadB
MGIGLGFGVGPLRVYVPLSGGRRRGGSRTRAATYGVCGVNHRSPHTAGRCKDCRRISAQRAAETVWRTEVEQRRRAALTDVQRQAEDRIEATHRVINKVGWVLFAATVAALCSGHWVVAIGLFVVCAIIAFPMGQPKVRLEAARQASVDAARLT